MRRTLVYTLGSEVGVISTPFIWPFPAAGLLFLQAMKTAMHIAAMRASKPPPTYTGYVWDTKISDLAANKGN